VSPGSVGIENPSPTAAGHLQQLLAKSLIADSDREGWTRHLKVIVLVAVITLLGALLDLRVAPTNLAMLYLLGAVFVSYRWGFRPALTYSIVSTVTFDFIFVPPYESFAVTDFWYSLTAITLMSVALFISILIAAVRQQAVVAARREGHTATLYRLMQSLASARDSSEVLRAAAAQFKVAFGLEVAVLLETEGGRLATQLESPGFSIDDSVHAAAERLFVASQSNPIRSEGAFLPLRAGGDVIGVMVLSGGGTRVAGDEALVLEAMAGQMALAIKRSVLAEKARAAEREQQQAQRAKAEAIATLAGGLAHDLNNLLTSVLGNASLAAVSLPENHSARHLLGELNKAGERAAHIVAQVLSYAGKGRFFDEAIDLSDLVADFVRSLPPMPEHLELSVKLEDHLPLLEGDRNQLLQLIGNLYLNAVEAVDQAAGRIEITTYQQRYPGEAGGALGNPQPSTGKCVCLSVMDTGCGIEESIQPRIFDPFFTTKFVGRGLGLSAAEGIMRAHNGAIRVSSEPGKGSTFTCQFAAVDEGSSGRAQA
jgi:K+-sensing histidine kinase KdpD